MPVGPIPCADSPPLIKVSLIPLSLSFPKGFVSYPSPGARVRPGGTSAEGLVTGPLAGPRTNNWSLRERVVPFVVPMTEATLPARLLTLGRPRIRQVQEGTDGR